MATTSPALERPIYTLAPWPTYEAAWLTTRAPRVLCWAGASALSRKVSGRDSSMLRDFVSLFSLPPEGRDERLIELATRFGPLGLCGPHGRPTGHLPAGPLREVQRALDDAERGEDGGPWWGLSPCSDAPKVDRVRTKVAQGRRHWAVVTEPVEAWIEWAGILYGVIAVAWRLQRGRPGDLDDWRLLDPALPAPADVMAGWTEDTTEGAIAPQRGVARPLFDFDESVSGEPYLTGDPPGSLYEVSRPYEQQRLSVRRWWEAASRENLVIAQRGMLGVVVDELCRLGDLRIRFGWGGDGAPRLSYGGGSFFGALVAQLSLVVGGVYALAICDYCREPFEPTTWPRSGPKDSVYCPRHQSDGAAKARHRRRTGRR